MGKLSFFDFLREQLSTVKPVASVDLSGQTVVVIGANTGIGFEACKHFARMNPARLILACRNQAKGEAALQKLQQDTDYKSAEVWIIDLSNFSSVTAFADKFEKDGGRLDILVANAASASGEYTATPDGWETSIQVNCLSLFLLSLRLLPKMLETGSKYATHPRFVTVTSEVHFWSQLQKTMPEKDSYKTIGAKEYCTPSVMRGRYMDTKLLDNFFYQALNERLGKESRVIVNGVNPGFCVSELRREVTGFAAMVMRLIERLIARTSEEGSRMLIWASVGGADNLDSLRGAYISCASVSEASDFAIKRPALQNRLWNEVIDILSKVDSHVQEVVEKHLSSPVSS